MHKACYCKYISATVLVVACSADAISPSVPDASSAAGDASTPTGTGGRVAVGSGGAEVPGTGGRPVTGTGGATLGSTGGDRGSGGVTATGGIVAGTGGSGGLGGGAVGGRGGVFVGSGGVGVGGHAGGSGGAAGGLQTICHTGQTHLRNLNNDNWAGSLTLFISYSSDTRSQTVNKGFTAAAWNAAVNSFNVAGFATQVANTGAKNILLMLGQNTGYYCSPNAAYENYAGVAAGTRCSVRDLPMEIADALAAKGIGLYLYLPEDVGWGDTKAANNFGLTSLALDNWVVDDRFTPKWNAVVKTWADRYGSKVRGWFFDGYDSRWGVTTAMAQTYRNTILAANSCAVVTFNGANGNGLSDLERGETRIDPATGLPARGLPTTRWTSSGLQTFWTFPLQAAWGQEIEDNSPAIYSDAKLKSFISAAIKSQTVFALDVRTSFAGALSKPVYDQLVRIKQ